MNIRVSQEKDFKEIYSFVKTAFETARVSDGTEQDFVLKLRAGETYLPELEFVAQENGILVGHIMLTKQAYQTTEGTRTGVLVAPLAVALPYRNRGIGGKRLRHACEQAVKAGHTAAFLVGNPQYYGRFGFRKTSEYGIKNSSDIPDDVVLGSELVAGALQGIRGEINII